jgi:hypothetical protein
MAWMASHLFFRGLKGDDAAPIEAVSELLRDPAHRKDQTGLLDPPAPVVLSAACEGWIIVTGLSGWLDDLVWAATKLAASTGALVVSCEIIGNSYRLQLSVQEADQTRKRLRMPEAGWSEEKPCTSAMPLYEDVEVIAYRTLRELGVPKSLIVIGTTPLGSASAQPMGRGVQLVPAAQQIERREIDLSAIPYTSDDPPVLPHEISRDFGLMLFESRYVEGKPTDAALERLLQLEEELLARAKRAQSEANVTLTVTYFAGMQQDRMDDMLRARGRPTAAYAERGARQPWWQFWRYFGRLK